MLQIEFGSEAHFWAAVGDLADNCFIFTDFEFSGDQWERDIDLKDGWMGSLAS